MRLLVTARRIRIYRYSCQYTYTAHFSLSCRRIHILSGKTSDIGIMGGSSTLQSLAPKNIYIIGAQCTGKTSLVNALENALRESLSATPPAVVKEVARSVLKIHGFTAKDITSDPGRCLQLQTLILEAQFNAEREALAKHDWIISDRSGMDPIIYASRHIGNEAVNAMVSSDYWRELRDRMSQSLVFVCETVEAWLVSDGVRLMPRDLQDWTEYDEEFCRMLDSAGIHYQMIPRSMQNLEDRVAYVWSEWKKASP
ncbi:AAA domain-containing protein [Trichoderma sp. TUCIM 5745]